MVRSLAQLISRFSIGLFCCVTSLFAQSVDTLLPVNEQGKWGFVNTKGIIVFPCQYESVLYWGTARYGKVKKEGTWNLITRQGNLLPLPFKGIPELFNDSILIIRSEEGQFLVSESGRKILPKSYQHIGKLSNGYFSYYEGDSCGLGHINQGIITPILYELIKAHGNHGFEVISCKKSGWINAKGELLLEPIYESIYYRNDGLLFPRLGEAFKLGIYDSQKQNWIITCNWDEISDSNSQFLSLADERGLYLYNLKIKEFYPQLFNQIELNNDVAKVENDSGQGIISNENKLVLPIEFSSIQKEHGAYITQKDSVWSLFNLEGKSLSSEVFASIQSLSTPAWVAERENDWILLDSLGNSLLSNMHDPEVLGNKVKYYDGTNMTSFQVNEKGKIISKQSFENVMKLNVTGYSEERSKPTLESKSKNENEPISRWFKDEKTKKWGLKFPDGKIAIPAKYDYIVNNQTYPYTHVYVKIYERETNLYGATFNIRARAGLVDPQSGKVLIEPRYVDVFLSGPIKTPLFFGITEQFFYQLIIPGNNDKMPVFAWVDNSIQSPVRCLGGNGIDRISKRSKDNICSVNSWTSRIVNPQFNYEHSKSKRSISRQYMTSSLKKWVYVFPGEINPLGYFSEAESFEYPLSIVQDYTTKKYGLLKQNGTYAVVRKFEFIRRKIVNGTEIYFLMKEDSTQSLVNMDQEIIPIENNTSIVNYDGQVAYVKQAFSVGFLMDLNKPVLFKHAEKTGKLKQGIIAVCSSSKWQYYFENGEKLNDESYTKAFDFYEGKAAVKDHGKWKFIYLNGELSEALPWKNMKPLVDGKFLAHNGKNWFITDTDGKAMHVAGFSKVSLMKNSPNIAVSNGTKWGLISPDGEMLIAIQYNRIQALGDDLYALSKGNRLFLKHENTKEKRVRRTSGIGKTAEGRFALRKKDGWVLADTSLAVLSDEKFNAIRQLNQGYTVAQKGNSSCLIDSVGTIAFYAQGRLIGAFSDGFILNYNSSCNGYSFLNKRGENIFEVTYSDAMPFDQGKAWVKEENGWGCIDNTGEWIIQPRFYAIRKLDHHAFLANSSYRSGVCDANGNILLEPIYDTVEIKENCMLSGSIGSRMIWKYTSGIGIYDRLLNLHLAKTP